MKFPKYTLQIYDKKATIWSGLEKNENARFYLLKMLYSQQSQFSVEATR
jgi:hypothetical protein